MTLIAETSLIRKRSVVQAHPGPTQVKQQPGTPEQPGEGAWAPALERGMSPQGRAEDSAVVRIDVGGKFQDLACG